MKVLFISTFNITIDRDHVFTYNVWKELRTEKDFELMSILIRDNDTTTLSYNESEKYWTLTIPSRQATNKAAIVEEIEKTFKTIKPTIIHSNMKEGYELEAAKNLGIPAMTTIHINTVICPSYDPGLLTPENNICDGKIGKKCISCCYNRLPLRHLSKAIYAFTTEKQQAKLSTFFNKHWTLYFTALFNIERDIKERQEYLKLLSYAHPIAANKYLYDMLRYHGIKPILLPHGIKPRNRIPMPPIDGKIKFYYIGRISMGKGLLLLIDAFKDIDPNTYEMHFMGHPMVSSRMNRRFFSRFQKELKSINGFFHDPIPNDRLEEKVKDWHVMIHPAVYHEVYGIAIAEALSMGRPVLATKCKGSEMQIEDGKNGWLVECNDKNALQNAIAHIIDNKDSLFNISQSCHIPMPIGDYVNTLKEYYQKYSL